MWTFGFLEQLAQDISYALRAMAANPLFTATAALSLAMGIGANTAIYSFMDAILMRSLPVAHPEQLAIVEWMRRGGLASSRASTELRTAMARRARRVRISRTPHMTCSGESADFLYAVRLHLRAKLQRDCSGRGGIDSGRIRFGRLLHRPWRAARRGASYQCRR